MSWAYNPSGAWTSKHQMSINGKWDDLTRGDLLAVANNVNIKQANSIIDQVVEAVSDWPQIAKNYGIPNRIIENIDKFLLYKI